MNDLGLCLLKNDVYFLLFCLPMNERKEEKKEEAINGEKWGGEIKSFVGCFCIRQSAERRKPNDDEYQQVGLNEKNEPVCKKGFTMLLFIQSRKTYF